MDRQKAIKMLRLSHFIKVNNKGEWFEDGDHPKSQEDWIHDLQRC
jgi:hypothetical protein